MSPTTHLPFVVVVWDDAHSSAVIPVTVKDIGLEHRASVFQTVGWLLQDDTVGVSIANERCLDQGDETYRGHTFIPRSLIRSINHFNLTRPRKPKEPTP